MQEITICARRNRFYHMRMMVDNGLPYKFLYRIQPGVFKRVSPFAHYADSTRFQNSAVFSPKVKWIGFDFMMPSRPASLMEFNGTANSFAKQKLSRGKRCHRCYQFLWGCSMVAPAISGGKPFLRLGQVLSRFPLSFSFEVSFPGL